MGIPKFYRWLSERYPLINQKIDGQVSPEFDCLYLDMNGIFHNCSHGTWSRKGMSHSEMYSKIFKYISHLVELVKPTKLLYMAVDGVAPRAKQNQQRQRRFIAARDRQLESEAKKKSGKNNNVSESSVFDANCITPGTEWMEKLSLELNLFIRKQISENNIWKRINVIYSDHLAPGEGEHKIMNYIRNMKMQSDYNQNLSHCIYGLDADLIMLSLISHEPHFALLREEVIFGLQQQARWIKQNTKVLKKKDSFQLLHISVLRKYLDLEFETLKDKLKFKYDLEKIIDDFVFLCTLVGCDFLPHIPTIDISTGGLQTLFNAYIKVLPSLNDYLLIHYETTNKHNKTLNIENVKCLFKELASFEMFSLKEQFKMLKKHYTRVYKERDRLPDWQQTQQSSKFKEPSMDDLDDMLDKFEAKDNTFKDKYYNDRWNDNTMTDSKDRMQLCIEYVTGLQWILDYYFQGCPSWSWYYPYFYAPLMSDMVDISNDFNVIFTIGEPYLPYQQLLAVLPIASNKFLPMPYRELMESNESPIHDNYPIQFQIDMNFSTVPWGGIALLPWINEELLRNAVKSIDESKLTKEQSLRNGRRTELLYKYDISIAHERRRISAPQAFGSMLDVCSVKEFILPEIKLNNGYFESHPPKGVIDVMPGYPQFNVFNFQCQTKKIPCRIFGLPSRYETLTINIFNPYFDEHSINNNDENKEDNINNINNEIMNENDDNKRIPKYPKSKDIMSDDLSHFEIDQIDNDAKQIMAEETIFVDWPYLREALVLEIETELFVYVYKYDKDTRDMMKNDNNYQNQVNPMNQLEIMQFEKDKTQIREWISKCAKMKDYYYSIFGIDCGPITTLIRVARLISMKRDSNKFTLSKQFDPFNQTVYPKSLLLWNHVDPRAANMSKMIFDERFLSSKIDFKQEFDIGSSVMYIGNANEYFGKYGRITQVYDTGFVDMRVISQFEISDFPHDVMNNIKKTNYKSLFQSAKDSNMNKAIFSRICGQIIIRPPRYMDSSDIDVGLNIKLARQGMIVPGFARGFLRNNDNDENSSFKDIYYSGRTVQLIKEYRKLYPAIFGVLASNIYEKNLKLHQFSELERIEVPFEEYLKQIDNDRVLEIQRKRLNNMNDNQAKIVEKEQKIKSTDDVLADLQKDLENMTLKSENNDKTSLSSSSSSVTTLETENNDDLQSIPTEASQVMTQLTENNDALGDIDAASMNVAVSEIEQTTDEKKDSKIENLTNNNNNLNSKKESNAIEAVFEAARQVTLEEIEQKKELQYSCNEDGLEYLRKVKDWIKNLKVNKLPLIPISSKVLSDDIIELIEKESNKYYIKSREKKPVGIKLVKIPAHHVYAADPQICWSPTPSYMYKLGDRVISLRSDKGVPFGTHGTVIGMHDNFLEILTDRRILGASSLHSRCSNYRGIMLPFDSVMSLTRPPHSADEIENKAMNKGDFSIRRSHSDLIQSGQFNHNKDDFSVINKTQSDSNNSNNKGVYSRDSRDSRQYRGGRRGGRGGGRGGRGGRGRGGNRSNRGNNRMSNRGRGGNQQKR